MLELPFDSENPTIPTIDDEHFTSKLLTLETLRIRLNIVTPSIARKCKQFDENNAAKLSRKVCFLGDFSPI
jgi:hypothetical protein